MSKSIPLAQRMTPREHPAAPAYTRPRLSQLLQTRAEWWLSNDVSSLIADDNITAAVHIFKLKLCPEFVPAMEGIGLTPAWPTPEWQAWFCLFEANLQLSEGN